MTLSSYQLRTEETTLHVDWWTVANRITKASATHTQPWILSIATVVRPKSVKAGRNQHTSGKTGDDGEVSNHYHVTNGELNPVMQVVVFVNISIAEKAWRGLGKTLKHETCSCGGSGWPIS